ncbi:MAG TPA: putative baseplate assembly protein, partial [Thermoanaerobaculia bacterium]
TCCLDPRTVTIYANVALASQGGTVPQEVLGSGDASVPNQRFSLRLPLTCLRAGAEIRPALELRVNGVLWKQVESLYESGPRDQVYMVAPGRQGLPVVLFGDGVHGARVPTGRENVVAVYRSGMWTDPVDPGHISIVQTRPIGVQAVSNPLSCPPGTPAETPGQTRLRAPRSVRYLDRIVSLSDYEDFTNLYPGVARAFLQTFWSGGRHLIYLTVAPDDARVLTPDDPLVTDLTRGIEQIRDAPRPFEIAGYQPVTFELAAQVLVDRRYRLPTVEAAIVSVLENAYSFAESRFGQILTSAEAITLIQGVAGVVSVELTAFHRTGAPARVEPQIRAEKAVDTPDGLHPAELLTIDVPGIALDVQVAP